MGERGGSGGLVFNADAAERGKQGIGNLRCCGVRGEKRVAVVLDVEIIERYAAA